MPRERLLDALTRSTTPLVLISAPAGAGKTTLAADWARASEADHEVVWVDCQNAEADPLREVLAALRPETPVASAVDWRLTAPAKRLELLLDAVHGSDAPPLVLLDGYEVTSLLAAHELESLLRAAGGRLRVGLTSRADPVLPLHTYRLHDTILEIRASDLAFTDEEAGQLLRECGARVDDDGVAALNTRLSGWAAGLRFAARALVEQPDSDELLTAAVSYNGDINAFLVEEVLNVQSSQVRGLMLAASIPDRLHRDLLEELTEVPAGPTILALTRANVFMEKVPGDESILEFIPFFRDLLRAQLAYEDPRRSNELNRRAADWYTQHGMWDEAVAHRVRAGDGSAVPDLLVEHFLLGRLLCGTPTEAMREAGAASTGSPSADGEVVAAALAYVHGDHAHCTAHLSAARACADLSDAGLVAVGVIDALRAGASEDAATAAELAGNAEALLSARGLSSGALPPAGDLSALVRLARATAALRLGALEQADALLRSALDSPTAAWSSSFRTQCLALLAVLDAHEGRVTDAGSEALQALRACEAEESPRPGLASRPERRTTLQSSAHLARAYVALEEYDLDTAEEHLARAASHPWPLWRALGEIVAAGVERGRGRLQPAARRINNQLLQTEGDPWLADWLRIEGSRCRLALQEPAQALVDLEAVDPALDQAAAARAAAHHAAGHRDAANELLSQLHEGSQQDVHAQVVALLVAADMSAHDSPQRARSAVREALRLARPNGLRRPFFEAGPQVLPLLTGQAGLPGSDWLHHVPASSEGLPTQSVVPAADSSEQLVEPLTPRELEVLMCLNELLSTDEIAEKLFVSVNTVRTHIRNILTKLGVTRRSAAVREARRLGLLSTP